MESIPISKFKATCLAVLHKVRSTGESVLVTRRGEPIAEIVPPSRLAQKDRRLGALAGRGRIEGDLLAPAVQPGEWEVLQG